MQLAVSEFQVQRIDDGRAEFGAALTLALSWTDPAVATESVEALWSPEAQLDFVDVVNKRKVGSPSYQITGTRISMQQAYEVTVKNSWDYGKYPFDTHKLSITLVAPELTQKTEPIQTSSTSVKTGELNVDDFSISEFALEGSGYGTAQGPDGSWGESQQVKITGDAKRRISKPLLGSVLPMFLTPFISYFGFFFTSDQIIARITLGGISLLTLCILYWPANFNDGSENSVGFALDTWLSWFALFQTLCVCVSVSVHACSHIMASNGHTEKSNNLDFSFKLLFPFMSASTVLAAYAISYWSSSESIPVCIALFVFWILAVVIASFTFDKSTKLSTAKSKDFPGI